MIVNNLSCILNGVRHFNDTILYFIQIHTINEYFDPTSYVIINKIQ